MRVYIVWQFDATPYESYNDGVHNIFSTKQAAQEYLETQGLGPHNEDTEYYDGGYYLSSRIQEWEVQS